MTVYFAAISKDNDVLEITYDGSKWSLVISGKVVETSQSGMALISIARTIMGTYARGFWKVVR